MEKGTTLFVDGNHENFALLNALPEKHWNGGRVHEVREHVLYLMRGQVFTFGGLTWFTMGGVASHDIQDGILDPADPDFERQYWLMRRMRAMFRVKGVSCCPRTGHAYKNEYPDGGATSGCSSSAETRDLQPAPNLVAAEKWKLFHSDG